MGLEGKPMLHKMDRFQRCSWKDTFTYLIRVVKAPFSRRRFTVISPPFVKNCRILDRRDQRIFSLETQSVSDYWTVSQVFFDQDYSIEGISRYKEIQRIYNDSLQDSKRSLILDLGANIGASARYLSLDWPTVELWCVEPSKRNVELLRRNVGAATRIFHAAIGGSDGYCIIENPNSQPDGFRICSVVGESSADMVELVSMQSMMKRILASGCSPFILKIDIEGAESELFQDAQQWLNDWLVVMIEIHDWMLPGSASSANVLKAFAEGGRDVIIRGSTLIAIRNGTQ